MENLKQFLETSTIHGVAYIASTRKLVRLLWTLIVFSGFLSSGILIYQSFDNWAAHPITTSIVTLPISEITLPNVTVCPPKDTYTNLNYDLMRLENVTMDNQTRKELEDFFFKELHDLFFKELLHNMSLFNEKDRFYNWYEGITKLQLPYLVKLYDSFIEYYYLMNSINTYANKGEIWLQYFGEDYDPSKAFNYKNVFYIHVSREDLQKENFTVSYEHTRTDQYYQSDVSNDNLTKDDATSEHYGYVNYFHFDDGIYLSELKDKSTMPGFRIKWKTLFYNFTSHNGYIADPLNLQFRWYG